MQDYTMRDILHSQHASRFTFYASRFTHHLPNARGPIQVNSLSVGSPSCTCWPRLSRGFFFAAWVIGLSSGVSRLGTIVEGLKQLSQHVFLLIYTYNPTGTKRRLDKDAMTILRSSLTLSELTRRQSKSNGRPERL